MNTITFGLFYKFVGTPQEKVTIESRDGDSGVKETKYYIANEDLIGGATGNAAIEKLKSAIDESKWVNCPSEGFNLTGANKYVRYAKAKDNVGNETYVSSEGLVLYNDAAQDTKNITYTRGSGANAETYVILNDNTIKEISISKSNVQMLDPTPLTADDYTKDNQTGKITFEDSYLDQLAAGNYTLTVNYNPQGME